MDLTIAYHAFFVSRCLLEAIIFQGPYQGFARFRRPCEHKTLESNKSLETIDVLQARGLTGCDRSIPKSHVA